MNKLKMVWFAFLQTIKDKAEKYAESKKDRLLEACVSESERIYRVSLRDGRPCILIDGKPAAYSNGEDDRLLERLFMLREAYVDECMKKGGLV